MTSATITAGNKEFYTADIAEVIFSQVSWLATEGEEGVLRISLTEDDLHNAAIEYALNSSDDLHDGSAFTRLGFSHDEDRATNFFAVYDTPAELAGDWEFTVTETNGVEEIVTVVKVA